jgi:hypothetical protein
MAVEWRERETKAASRLRECRAALAARRSTAIGEASRKASVTAIEDWRHYPEGEVYDPASHVQYFFHRHPPAAAGARGADDGEFGHFHVFLGGDGIPAGITPLLLPDVAVANAPMPRLSVPLKRGNRDEVCHLVAIAVDARGEPIGLFTTNRWVTGETWYRAEDVIGLLDRVRLGVRTPASLLDRWIESLVELFRPEIAALLRKRDKAILDWRWRWPRCSAFEDPRLEITSSLAIDLDARLAAVEAARSLSAAEARRGGWLPSMAEGWGA